jgi:hypothetical protein
MGIQKNHDYTGYLFRIVFWDILPAVYPRRQFWPSYSPPWELEISHTGICQTTKSADFIAVGLCSQNALIICRGKAVSGHGYYITHCKHVLASSRQMMEAFNTHKPIATVSGHCVVQGKNSVILVYSNVELERVPSICRTTIFWLEVQTKCRVEE